MAKTWGRFLTSIEEKLEDYVVANSDTPNVQPLLSHEQMAERIRRLDGELIQIQAEGEKLEDRYGRAMAERTHLQRSLLEWTKSHMQGWRISAECIVPPTANPSPAEDA